MNSPDRLSVREIYLTKAGIPADADLSDASVGTDVSAQINELTLARQGKPTRFIADGAFKAGDIKLYSGHTLEGYGGQYWGPSLSLAYPKSGIIQAPGSQCILRNANWRSPWDGAASTGDYSRILDEGVTIRSLFLNGNRGSNANSASAGATIAYTFGGTDYAYPPDPRFSARGQLIAPLWISGVRGLVVENVMIYNPSCYHTMFSYIDGATIRDLFVCDPLAVTTPTNLRNTDGCHINGPARNVTVVNVDGYSCDDLTTWTADDINLVPNPNASGGSPNGGPMIYGGWGVVYKGDLTNCSYRAVRSRYALSVIRLETGTSLIDKVAATDVRGRVNYHAITNDVVGGIGGDGNVGSCYLGDWDVDVVGGVNGYVYSSNNTRRLDLVDHKRGTLCGNDGINVTGGTIDLLSIRGYRVDEAASVTQNLVNVSGGVVNDLRLDDVRWGRGSLATTAGAVVAQTGGAIGQLHLRGVAADRVRALYSQSAGTVPTPLLVSACSHTNKDGANASIAAASTLPVLAGAGNYGVTASGTITDQSKFASA